MKLVCLFTDPNGPTSILQACRKTDTPIDNLYYRCIPPAKPNFKDYLSVIDDINRMSYDDLCKQKYGLQKADYRQLYEVISALGDFTCDRTGTHLGPIDELDPTEYALAVDGCTGLAIMCLHNHLGAKPTPHEGEWGVVMNTFQTVVTMLLGVPQLMVLIGHEERQYNETSGVTQRQLSTIGKKLSPKIPGLGFSDSIEAYVTTDGRYLWSTRESEADVKHQVLPPGTEIEASFKPFVDDLKHQASVSDKVFGAKALIFGRPGAGKTHALTTILKDD